MGFYRFKEKGPAFGLGYTEGEVVEFDEKKKIIAKCLVPVVDREGKPVGRQVIADKEYTVEFLVDSGVISLANEKDLAKVKSKTDINSIADAENAKAVKEDKEAWERRKAVLK